MKYMYSAEEILNWKKLQLVKGGRLTQLEWLLDIAGGIDWQNLQKLKIDPCFSVELNEPLEALTDIWDCYCEENVPLQYLVGRCPWRDFELEVSAAALIPRQETELLVDLALNRIDKTVIGHWSDLGTGSGAIAVALSRALPGWTGHAVDISQDALDLAERNLKRLSPNINWTLHSGSWWEPLKPWWGLLSLVIANPPYIPTELFSKLEPEVVDHEPRSALLGGIDGLDASREIIRDAKHCLSLGGLLCLEHHYDQSDRVLELLRANGLGDVEYASDLDGVRRFALAKRLN